MKKATITFITSAALAFAIPLYAADEPGMKSDSHMKSDSYMKSDSQQKAGLTQQQTGKMHSDQMINADKLEGMTVVSQEGEKIGEIKTIKIDKKSGEVQFVTFSKGGILGIGGEEVAAPLSAFEFGDEEARLTVNQSKLENVPKQTAEATDSDYQRDLETHYGVAPAWNKKDMGDTPKNQKMDQDSTEPRKVDPKN